MCTSSHTIAISTPGPTERSKLKSNTNNSILSHYNPHQLIDEYEVIENIDQTSIIDEFGGTEQQNFHIGQVTNFEKYGKKTTYFTN